MYKSMLHAILLPGLLAWILVSCEGTGIAMAMDERGAVGKARDERLGRELRTSLDHAARNAGRVADSVMLSENEVVQGIYAQHSERRFWVDTEGLKVSGKELGQFIDSVLAYGLFPRHYPGREVAALRRSTGDSVREGDEALWSRKELLLTDAFVRLARHLRIGRLPEDSISLRRDSLIEASNMLALLHRMDAGESVRSVLESMEPSHANYHDLKKALRPQLDSLDLRPYTYLVHPQKDSMKFIRQLQTRLFEGGYLASNARALDSTTLSKAIRKAQAARRLKVDGLPGKELVRSLNNTDYSRFMRIAMNLDRYRQLPDPMPDRYIWVNLPSYRLQYFDSGRMRLETPVIIGTPSNRTPVLNSGVDRIVTYPFWTVPYSIVFNEMLPRIRRDPSYLTRRSYQVVDSKGRVLDPHSIDWSRVGPSRFPYAIRQREGDFNSLGVLKFNFPNKYAVYLHDTNARALFARTNRSLSHGCVRVQHWRELAGLLLSQDTVGAQADSLLVHLERKQQRTLGMEVPTPIYLRYITAYVKDGRIRFYEDIYGEDLMVMERHFTGRLL